MDPIVAIVILIVFVFKTFPVDPIVAIVILIFFVVSFLLL